MNQTVNYAVYTDIAGFTMMMMSATFSVHYHILKKSACVKLEQKWVRINSLIIYKVISLISDD